MADDELVSVPLIREDLRQLLVAASIYVVDAHERGDSTERVELAIQRVGDTASMGDWQGRTPGL